jgi:hypothetical protein
MKLSSLFVAGTLIAALAFAVPVAKADGLPPGDPIIKAAGAGIDAPAGIVTTSFTISSSTGTSPETSPCLLNEGGLSISSPNCQFINVITNNGQPEFIDSLEFILPNVPLEDTSCATTIEGDVTIFTTCSRLSDGNGGSVIFFTGGNINYLDIFTLDFEGFPAGYTAGVVAQLPEPGSVLMLAIGLLGLLGLAFRRSAARVN